MRGARDRRKGLRKQCEDALLKSSASDGGGKMYEIIERVVNVRTGEVHFKSGYEEPGKIYAQCRILPRSDYEITDEELTCEDCKEQERRSG